MNSAPAEAAPVGTGLALSEAADVEDAAPHEPGEPRDDDGVDDPYAAGSLSHADLVARRAALAAPASDSQLAAWMDAIVERDERALGSLYDATFSRVFGLVQSIVRRPALAEEVVEDTYFQVWRQAPRFDPARGTALTWLLAIARSRALDAIRREVRFQHETLAEDQAPAMACTASSTDELLEVARNHASLHGALMRLGAQPRQLVSLAFFRGLSHEEIASQTRLPVGTVKSQIRRAMLALREILGDGGANPIASCAGGCAHRRPSTLSEPSP